MKFLDKLAKQAVQDQHSAIRKEYKIPGYEKGFIDGFNKAIELAAKHAEFNGGGESFGIRDIGNEEVE